MKQVSKWLLCAALSLAVAGCASGGEKKSDGQKLGQELGKDLSACTTSLAKLETDLKAVLASHDAIINNTTGDYATPFKEFGKGLDKLEKSRQTARASYDEVNSTAGTFFAAWQTGSESFSSEAMREKSHKLLEKVQKEFGEIWEEAPGARKAYGEVTKMLGDHRLYWSTMLNKDTAAEMKKDEKKIKNASEIVFEGIAECSKAAKEFDEAIRASVKPAEKTSGTTTPSSGTAKP